MIEEKSHKTCEALIVGAGPVGLMMACQLALQKVSFRIIDKRESCTSYSGALIIHARSLEIFDQMGMAEEAIENGIIAGKISVVFNGKKKIELAVKDVGRGLSKYPYMLLLEQSKTEQMLQNFLSKHGIAVEKGTELLSFTQDTIDVTSTLKTLYGKEETIKTTYLVGADGSRSTVRTLLKIPFVGETNLKPLFILDCKADVTLAADEISFLFSNSDATAFFPLKNKRWRIDGTIAQKIENNSALAFFDIKNDLLERINVKATIFDQEWFSVFHSHQRYAASLQQGNCFLIGDAARVHSPVGAQGMNTGFQDAHNLALKLAFVIQKKAKPELLNTYATERLPIAKNLVRTTNTAFKLLTAETYSTKMFRRFILPFFLKFIFQLIKKRPSFRYWLFGTIAQTRIHYRSSSLSQRASIGQFPNHAPKPGDRVPYVLFNHENISMNIQDKIKLDHFYLLVFAKHTLPDELFRIARKYMQFITMDILPFSPSTKRLYEKFGIQQGGFYLIRPDMHVAFRSQDYNTDELERYIQRNLIRE